MKKKNLLVDIAKFFIPFILGFIGIASVGYFLLGDLMEEYFSLVAGYFFPPLGKESIIPTGVALGINPLIMALSIAFVDIVVALFLVWNYDLAKKIPLIGKFITKVEKLGKGSSDKYEWVKPLRFFGIILFVIVPFQGSGGLVGSIVGRLVGMKPWNIFLAISIGAISGTILIAYFANFVKSVFIKNFMLGLMIVIVLLVIGVMVFFYKRNKKT